MKDPGYRRCAFNAADHPLGCPSRLLFRGGTTSRRGAKPRCRSGLSAVICSSNITANTHCASTSGTSPKPFPGGSTRPADSFAPSFPRPLVWTIVFWGMSDRDLSVFHISGVFFIAAGFFYKERIIKFKFIDNFYILLHIYYWVCMWL